MPVVKVVKDVWPPLIVAATLRSEVVPIERWTAIRTRARSAVGGNGRSTIQ